MLVKETKPRPVVITAAVAISSIVKNVQVAYARDVTLTSSAARAADTAHVVITAKNAVQVIIMVHIILFVATLTFVKLAWVAQMANAKHAAAT